jgi:hypothetical protein
LPRLGRAVFDPIDRALRHADSFAEIGLTPTQHGPAGAKLGGEQLPGVFGTVRRRICFQWFDRHGLSQTKKPPADDRRGLSMSCRDQAIRAGSRGERER